MIEKNFNPATAEPAIRNAWEEKKLYASCPESAKPKFSIVMPPPNVTGNLHIGHALDNSIQDALCRYKRMQGFDVLWQPGTDHAGIATQVVVEKQLAKQNISRHDLGREKFLEKVWQWKKESGGNIIKQLRFLGASCDWDRERFTMDEGLSKAVRKVFVQLFKEGLIYKDFRLVNWDPVLQTAISDIEVKQVETVGKMWYIRYPVEGNPNEFVRVATTRPETMFGDTAVAVSPKDERYKHLIGKNVILPIVNRPIPVVGDEHADPEKGTGAVKITPAHDFNDFEVGKRQNLDMVNILDKEAKLNENVPEEFRGLSCLEARPKVLEKLKELGLYEKEEDNPMTIPHGERTGVIIEPFLTEQWFVNAKELAKEAIEVVKDGRLKFVPKNWENTYFEWMNNIQPWCISRQLWWGHQVPVWYAPDGTAFCEETEEEAMLAAAKKFGMPVPLKQDKDVLDTWFSSGLWAFSTLGWPQQTEHLKKYYPTSTLVTGFDIIFFWVARMIMLSMHFQKAVPFKDVCLHGLVRDEKGQKMSKSKGNGIDPLVIIEKYGADALRLALLAQAGQGRDVLMSEGRVETYRNFITKIWNAARFCEMNGCVGNDDFNIAGVKMPVNMWILSKLNATAQEMETAFDTYAFNDALYTLYHFVWGNFCDWYLELIKPVFYGQNEEEKTEVRQTSAFVLDSILKLTHPFAPFVTEELWKQTKERSNMIMEEKWPVIGETDKEVEKEQDWLIGLITAVRSLRTEVNIPAGTKITVHLKDLSLSERRIVEEQLDAFKALTKTETVLLATESVKDAVTAVYETVSIYIPTVGVINVPEELARLGKEAQVLTDFITRTEQMLANKDFIGKAPAKIIEGKQKSLEEAKASLSKVEDALSRLKGL